VDPIERRSVVDVLEERLRDDILGGVHPAGTHLPPERELAAGYGVNRATLKHALSRLEQAGLLTTRHGVGSQVRDFVRSGGADLLPLLVRHDARWLDDVFEARRAIGSVIAQQAASRAGSRSEAFQQVVRAVRQAPDARRAQSAEAEVHRELARLSRNRVYVLLTNTLLGAYLPVRHLLTGPFEDPVLAGERLLPLAAAVGAADAAAAGRAASDYLDLTGGLMLSALRDRE
jgi:DNA-binding FadR family transcriptional regulator